MVEKDNKALKEGSILASLTQATKKLPKPKKVKNPKATERLYYQLLNKLIRRAQDTFRDIVVPVGKGEPMRYNADATKPQDNFSFILEALAAWQKKVNDEIFTPENIERISERVGSEVNKRNKRELSKTYDKITPIDLANLTSAGEAQLQAFTMENASYIRKVSEEIIANTQRIITDRIPQGKRWEQIVGEIERGLDGNAGVFKNIRTRAKLIARDQTNKLNGQLTKARQEELGMKLYRWSTVGDARVRSKHARLDGNIYSWSGTVRIDGKTYEEAPGGITPGSEINCRCVAEPVLEV